jgi:lysophospholipase L1-like esterase
MLIRAVLLEWVEWIINQEVPNNEGPGIRRAFCFPPSDHDKFILRGKTANNCPSGNGSVIRSVSYISHMVRVKRIALIICMVAGAGRAPDPAPLTYLALGDSYTIGESVGTGDCYPVQVVRRLQKDNIYYKTPDIIAVTGWTTGNLLTAMPAAVPGQPYHVVSLLIGVNNQYQHLSQSEYRTQFTQLLQQSIRLAGDRPSHVIVLSIPDYSVTPFARGSNRPYIAAQIDSFNMINREISQAYQVEYIDVTGESRKAAKDASLIAGDSLHFSSREYAIWAEMMEPVMKAP